MNRLMKRFVCFSLFAALLIACQSEKQKEFDELTQRAKEIAGKLTPEGPPSQELEVRMKNAKADFDNWAKKNNTQSVEQQGKLLNFSSVPGTGDRCEWFSQLETGGKTGACFAKQERMTMIEGSAKRACIYDCFYP